MECLSVDELEASRSFFKYYSENYYNDDSVTFNVCGLQDALRHDKISILYLHNVYDPFSETFCSFVQTFKSYQMDVRKFHFVGWDVGNDKYYNALLTALQTSALPDISNMLFPGRAITFVLIPSNNIPTYLTCLKGNMNRYDIYYVIKDVEETHGHDIVPCSVKFQQIMGTLLGNRTYDSFEHNQHDLLKKKIGFSLFGQPKEVCTYNTPHEQRKIQQLFRVILRENNIIAKWKNRIRISFIFNCIQPPAEDTKNKSSAEINMNPIPVFILRKCKNSPNPCRVFVDEIGRVYETWESYLEKNKLPPCSMILPKNGIYQFDENGQVELETHSSPACGLDAKVLLGLDITSAVVGFTAGGICLAAAAIPAIVAAPVVLMGVTVAGIGAGTYGVGRNIYALYDKHTAKESLSPANSEARGAYLNIIAGALGFCGVGANMAIAQLSAKGVNIGKEAVVAVNTINILNLSASGINVANSSYDIITQWHEENQTPSVLSLVQLSSSILFFGNAVYNFKLAGTIVEETQSNVIRDFKRYLKGDCKKTFTQLLTQTIKNFNGDVRRGRSEVISAIRKILDKNEVFKTLTKAKSIFTENDVQLSAKDGQIYLNGTPIDINLFGQMNNIEIGNFLTRNISPPSNIASVDIVNTTNPLKSAFTNINKTLLVNLPNIPNLALYILQLYGCNNEVIKEKCCDAVTKFILKLEAERIQYLEQLKILYPNVDLFLILLNLIKDFFDKNVNELNDKYQLWNTTQDPQYYELIFAILSSNSLDTYVNLFNYANRAYFNGSNLNENGLKELFNYFLTWFSKQMCDYQEDRDRRTERLKRGDLKASKVPCSKCGGYYYSN